MIPSTDTPSGDAPVAGSDSGSPSPSAANPAGVSRDQLTLDWGNDVLARLSPRARALYSAGRFVAAEGARAAFAVPNGPHMAKCETLRRDVEAVLESHYGQPVELVLMVEGEDVPPLGAPEHQEEPEEIVDVDDLVDAPDQGDAVSRLQAAFPGAKLVEPGPEQ